MSSLDTSIVFPDWLHILKPGSGEDGDGGTREGAAADGLDTMYSKKAGSTQVASVQCVTTTGNNHDGMDPSDASVGALLVLSCHGVICLPSFLPSSSHYSHDSDSSLNPPSSV